MKRPRVLYCASTDTHLLRFHLPYIKALSKTCDVCVMGNGNAFSHKAPFCKQMLSPKNLLALLEIRRLLRRERFDLILTHTVLASFLVRLAAKGLSRPPRITVTVHGYLFSEKLRSAKDRLLLLCERLVRGQTDLLLVMNREDLALAKRYDLSQGKIRLIRGMGLPARERNAKPIHLRRRLGLSDKHLLCLYVGELSKRKNQLFLIRAFHALRQRGEAVFLVLVGDGAERETILEEIRKRHMEDAVFLAGEEKEVYPYLLEADLYVSASRSEGLPFNVLEAMEVGLPILASRVKGQEDLLDDCPDALYPEGDEEAFCRRLLALKQKGRLGAGSHEYPKLDRYRLDSVFAENLALLRGGMPK